MLRVRMFVLVLLLLLALGAVSVQAQELTPEVTFEATPVVSPVTDVPESSAGGWFWNNIGVIFIALWAVSGIAKDWLHGRNLKLVLEQNDKSRKDAIEAAAKQVPDSLMESFRGGLSYIQDLTRQWSAFLTYVDSVTDELPNDDPPPPSPAK